RPKSDARGSGLERPTGAGGGWGPAQERRRAITGASLIALVRSGARFKNGVLVEWEEAGEAA
ncbi:hypothetical protein EYS09_23075, partial [Streptomyces kasugaensis]